MIHFHITVTLLNSDLTAKVAGFTSGSYTKVTGLAYDSTNKKLGLKVNGADTVIPFSSGGLLPLYVTKQTGAYSFMYRILNTDGSTYKGTINTENGGTAAKAAVDLSDIISFVSAYTTYNYIVKPKKAGYYLYLTTYGVYIKSFTTSDNMMMQGESWSHAIGSVIIYLGDSIPSGIILS